MTAARSPYFYKVKLTDNKGNELKLLLFVFVQGVSRGTFIPGLRGFVLGLNVRDGSPAAQLAGPFGSRQKSRYQLDQK